jgi:hypothetical protein
MATPVQEGSLRRFRNEAQAIRDRAVGQIFALLCAASLSITLLFALAIVALTPRSHFLWPIGGGLVLSLAAAKWTHRTRRTAAGIGVLATMMVAGISGVVLVQRGSHAPALVYGLTTVAVVFIAGRGRLATVLGLCRSMPRTRSAWTTRGCWRSSSRWS